MKFSRKLAAIGLLLLALLPADALAWDCFPTGLPKVVPVTGANGTGCVTCHESRDGGGPRNAFGRAVEGELNGRHPTCFTAAQRDEARRIIASIWTTLANADSDRDGYANDVELQIGRSTTVDITNPGLSSSVPCGCDIAARASCDVRADSWQCRCRTGFNGDGKSCTDTNECSLNPNRCGNGRCVNRGNGGGYDCQCNTGYQPVGDFFNRRCEPQNECNDGTSNCVDEGQGGRCTDLDPGFRCSCASGYAGNGVRTSAGGTGCTDINECNDNSDGCDSNPDACRNQAGSFSCVCPEGFRGNGVGENGCQDIDECVENRDNCDGDPDACRNAVGSFMCLCPSGYRGNGVGIDGCIEIDECAENTDGCDSDPNACVNTPGSFMCQCPRGFRGNGRGENGCAEIDECAEGIDNCSDDATCTNTVGSYNCTCKSGYRGDGVTCNDINECAEGTAGCHADATCTNSRGSFACACKDGYRGDGVSCANIDECSEEPDTCHADANCFDVPGSYNCVCRDGYSGDGKSCTDIDECASGVANCASDATCENSPGSFSCDCLPGFIGEGTACFDIDECADGSDGCSDDAVCTNTRGSFLCTCNAGFSGDGLRCEAVCGDGLLKRPEEQCEDGNTKGGDGCDETCRIEPGYACQFDEADGQSTCALTCGDGLIDPLEACDHGGELSDTRPDACRTTCQWAHCGDGVIDTGESCEDGNGVAGDGCTECAVDPRWTCAWNEDARRSVCTGCGDGVLAADELCDDGADNSDVRPDACRLDCTLPRCGDGVLDSGEACEPDVERDCSDDCQAPTRPGDGVDAGTRGDAAVGTSQTTSSIRLGGSGAIGGCALGSGPSGHARLWPIALLSLLFVRRRKQGL